MSVLSLLAASLRIVGGFRHVEGEGYLIYVVVINPLVLVQDIVVLVAGDGRDVDTLPQEPEGGHQTLALHRPLSDDGDDPLPHLDINLSSS